MKEKKKAELTIMFQWASQIWADAFIIETGRSEVMGKDTFGPERAERVLRAIEARAQEIEQAITKRHDADAMRVQVDRALKQRVGDKMIPWSERYSGWEE